MNHIDYTKLPDWLLKKYDQILSENKLTWNDITVLINTEKSYGIGTKHDNKVLYWIPKSQLKEKSIKDNVQKSTSKLNTIEMEIL